MAVECEHDCRRVIGGAVGEGDPGANLDDPLCEVGVGRNRLGGAVLIALTLMAWQFIAGRPLTFDSTAWKAHPTDRWVSDSLRYFRHMLSVSGILCHTHGKYIVCRRAAKPL